MHRLALTVIAVVHDGQRNMASSPLDALGGSARTGLLAAICRLLASSTSLREFRCVGIIRESMRGLGFISIRFVGQSSADTLGAVSAA